TRIATVPTRRVPQRVPTVTARQGRRVRVAHRTAVHAEPCAAMQAATGPRPGAAVLKTAVRRAAVTARAALRRGRARQAVPGTAARPAVTVPATVAKPARVALRTADRVEPCAAMAAAMAQRLVVTARRTAEANFAVAAHAAPL